MSSSILQPLDVSSEPSQFLWLRRRQGTLRASALIRLSLSGPAAHRGFCNIHLPAHSAGSATVLANQIDNLCFEFETAISLPLRLCRNLKGQYRPISGVHQIRVGSGIVEQPELQGPSNEPTGGEEQPAGSAPRRRQPRQPGSRSSALARILRCTSLLPP